MASNLIETLKNKVPYTFVIPEYNPSGEWKEDVLVELEDVLVDTYRQIETSECLLLTHELEEDGGEAYSDVARKFTVPVENTHRGTEKLEKIIHEYGVKLGQKYVRVLKPTGEYLFIHIAN